MHFRLLDRVLESGEGRIVTLKSVSASEEYLQDHFPTFPVLPGVFMLEAMVQAARELLRLRDPALARHVLGGVRALKYGSFVRPGESMRVEVSLLKSPEGSGGDSGGDSGGAFEFKGSAAVLRPDASRDQAPPTCVSGRFALRPPRPGGS